MDFKTRRINHFKKNLVDLAELELKHARVSISLHSLMLIIINNILQREFSACCDIIVTF